MDTRLLLAQAFFSLAIAGASPARAEIYKCTDAEGRVSYTNLTRDAGKNCESVTREIGIVSAPPKAPAKNAPAATGGDFPRVSGDAQKQRDVKRRQILEQELAEEERLLGEAKKTLAEQEAVRQGDERNYQKYLDRIQKHRDEVTLHEKNITALRDELSRAR